MRNFLIMLVFSLGVTTQLQAGSDATPLSLVPKPNHLEQLPGEFHLSEKVQIVCSDENLKQEADYLQAALSEAAGFNVAVADVAPATGAIILKLDEGIAGEEAYSIRSSEDKYEISGKSSAGVFYGIQTFLQLIPVSAKGNIALPLVKIDDEPRFEWRGMHLDVCRHFYSVDVVKKLINQMSRYKLNTFHWHLTEDQGWRIEIKKYPKLTEIGAWRDETVVGHMADYPHRFDGEKHGGFYTQEQVKDVVAYAAARHVTIVPEIEMPGHAQAALAAYPWLGCFDDTLKVWPLWGVSENVYCAGKESTFEFLQDVLDEVIPLFPGTYFHVGGDECPKENWEKCPLCQKRMKEEGCKDEHELQSWFIQRMEHYLATKGKKLIGWDEILEGGLAENAAVMSWRGEKGGIEAAELGHKVVMTPGNWCYFDHYQSIDSNEPTAIGGLTDLAEVYSYDPVPAHLPKDKQKLIMGAQANLWTEYIPTSEQLEYMIYPRLCALSEVQWTEPANKDFADFELRMDENYLRLARNDIHFRVPPPEGLSPVQIYEGKEATITLSCAAATAEIRYTTDGSEPTEFSALYAGPFKLKLDGDLTLKATSFLGDGTKSYTVKSVLKTANLKPVKLKNPEKGLNYKFYDAAFRSFRDVGGEAIKTGTVDWLVIPAEIMGKLKGWAFDGYISVPTDGSYYFQLNSSCGSGLYIGDELVIDNDGLNYDCTTSGRVELKAGYYPVKVKYFNTVYGQSIKLSYKRPGSDKLEVFPGEKYFRE
ncbi:family 20 glycosylhydrolase [Mangrovibacterium lignilyticum]|uniref:family 20 glycosylhydrolase n=1 Tax=Mangrovibacterium lignilyticum TaxID=2668052 RepID=UPI0013D8A3B4|nr:family 20 glycosylhydrolase [Mangrovibacterium lignilyticum]